ncbi:MAG: ribonucleotide-diphosphate reductase subunit beta [Solirubrobacterales bacterium]
MSAASELAVNVVSSEDLYHRWEHSHWSATDLDFTEDKRGWQQLSDIQRRSGVWLYSMFFYGEDSVTDNLSPYIDAAPKEEQKYFLATQQVDEARHSVFFARFFREVIGAGDSIASGLAYTEPELNWGYRKVFAMLDRVSDELREDRSLPSLARAIAMYHLIVEATLAQPGQHYIEDFFTREGTLPGFRQGMENVSRDEQRHIAFGVKMLSELIAESHECKQAVIELLREVMRYSVALFLPPDWNREYTECYGFTLEDVYAFGFRSFETRFRAAGLPIEEMPADIVPFNPAMSYEERARRQLLLAKAGVIGEPNDNPDSSAQTQELVFGIIERVVDDQALDGSPATLQWRFEDADPWHLRIDNGSTEAMPGYAESPDLTFDARWADWVQTAFGDKDPRVAMLTRKLRPHGSMRLLLKMPQLFPGSR